VQLYSANMPSESEKTNDKVDESRFNNATDISLERMKQLESLVRQRTKDLKRVKQYDMLTGVPLRSIFLKRVETEISIV